LWGKDVAKRQKGAILQASQPHQARGIGLPPPVGEKQGGFRKKLVLPGIFYE
jgi:hypothetical protein